MPAKKEKASNLDVHLGPKAAGRVIQWIAPVAPIGKKRLLRSASTASRTGLRGNRYLCALECNQNGKYNVRIRAFFASRDRESETRGDGAPAGSAGWVLPVFFLASSFNAGMKKLEESLQNLQKNEARLRFWGLERTDDPNLAGEMLQEFGLRLDRRRDFPRKVAEILAAAEKPVAASALASIRRVLADSLAQERPAGRLALAGD